MKSSKFLALLLGLFLSMPISLYGQTSIENPASVIMQRVIEKAKTNNDRKTKHLGLKKHYTDTKVDDNGRSKKIITDQIIQVAPPDGHEILIEEDGHKKNKRMDSRGEFEKILEALSQLFEYETAGPTSDCPACPLISENGKAYLVIKFKAKSNARTDRDDIKEIMVRSAGKIEVDIENLYIKRFESHMVRNYDRVGGAFQLKQADVVLDQEEIDTPEGKVIAVKAATINYRYSLFILGETQGTRSWIFSEYQYVQ
ncbi:MAG: hypothetical protein HYT64_02365 [Candidatus Yanofskybacteria bacterium]|nr:hypothetical protein [Candidatus Yanofskybacteria bacterium]